MKSESLFAAKKRNNTGSLSSAEFAHRLMKINSLRACSKI